MKIKEVCTLTELSDRTIRFYIEQELIHPEYTENYFGRKSYEFDVKDVEELKDIAILRKFGFSVAEIKDIIVEPCKSKEIISDVKNRKVSEKKLSEHAITALNKLNDNDTYSVAEIAEALRAPEVELSDIQIKDKPSVKSIIFKIVKITVKSIFIYLPYLLYLIVLFLVTLSNLRMAYPAFYYQLVSDILIYMFIPLMSGIIALIVNRIKKAPKIISIIISLIGVITIPYACMCLLISPSVSITENIVNYRRYDGDCIINCSVFSNELFPTWPHYFNNVKNENGEWEAIYLDAKYYYRYIDFIDYTYDVYAEWPLEEDAFEAEVKRVHALYDELKEYSVIEKGNYTCLVVGNSYCGNGVFEKQQDNYDFDIFSYDEENLRVRYISCSSLENGVDQPYHLQLDW